MYHLHNLLMWHSQGRAKQWGRCWCCGMTNCFFPNIFECTCCSLRGGGIQEGGVVVSSSSTEEAPMPVLDESKPTTMLQIRLKDGRRIKHQFNTSHTLRHIQVSYNFFLF